MFRSVLLLTNGALVWGLATLASAPAPSAFSPAHPPVDAKKISRLEPWDWDKDKANVPISGDEKSGYALSVPSSDASKFPFSAIVQFTSTFETCSGALIGANVVLTAAHCLAYYEPGKSGKTPVAAKDIHLLGSDLWPGCTASGAIVSETWTPPRWGHPNRLVSVENDYGLMRLSCNPGNTVGWLGYGFTGRKPKAMSRSGQIGYFRKSAPLSQSQTAATSAPLDVLKRVRGFFSYDANLPALAFYNHTTEPGVSGSPVFSQGKWTECANCVVAVHGHSARDIDETIPDSKQFLKLGVMITGQVFKDIRQFVEKKK